MPLFTHKNYLWRQWELFKIFLCSYCRLYILNTFFLKKLSYSSYYSCQTSDIPTKIIKLNPDIISHFIYVHFGSRKCGFRKGFSAQHCLLVMIEKFKEAIDRGNELGNEFGALLTDLSKAFNCITHPLLIAKFQSYGVLPLSINMISSYLINRTQWTKLTNVLVKNLI